MYIILIDVIKLFQTKTNVLFIYLYLFQIYSRPSWKYEALSESIVLIKLYNNDNYKKIKINILNDILESSMKKNLIVASWKIGSKTF